MEGLLARLLGRGRAGLLDGQDQRLALPFFGHGEERRAGLVVPAPELGQRQPRRALHRRNEILNRSSLAIVLGEVRIRPGAEPFAAENGGQHPHHLGALLVHRCGVEVVDLEVALRAHRMRQRAAVLDELHVPQERHVRHALDGAGVHVRRELGVPIDGEAFLQAQLEPVPAGDAVAGPVVEVLVRHHALNALVGGIGGGIRGGQDEGRVEDVEALVLHRPHVEALHRDDHEDVQIVFAPEALLIPAHRPLQRRHREPALADVVRFRVDAQRHPPPGAGDELVLQERQIPGHQGEQIARLGEGIAPGNGAAAGVRFVGNEIAVGEQYGIALRVRRDAGDEAGEHIRPIRVVGHLAKPLGLALRAVHGTGFVEALQRGVRLRLDARFHLHAAGRRHVEHAQRLALQRVFVAREGAAVYGKAEQLHIHTVQLERRIAWRLAFHGHRTLHDGLAVADVKRQRRLGEAKGIGPVVGEAHGCRHGGGSSRPLGSSTAL